MALQRRTDLTRGLLAMPEAVAAYLLRSTHIPRQQAAEVLERILVIVQRLVKLVRHLAAAVDTGAEVAAQDTGPVAEDAILVGLEALVSAQTKLTY